MTTMPEALRIREPVVGEMAAVCSATRALTLLL